MKFHAREKTTRICVAVSMLTLLLRREYWQPRPDSFVLWLQLIPLVLRGEGGLVVGRWTYNPEVPGSNPLPCHYKDLSSVAPNSVPPRLVNSQLVSLPPVGILNLLCLICIVFVTRI